MSFKHQPGHSGHATGYDVQQAEYTTQTAAHPQYEHEYQHQTAGNNNAPRGYFHPNGANAANRRTSMDNEPGSVWSDNMVGDGDSSSHFLILGIEHQPIIGRYLEEDQLIPRRRAAYEENAEEASYADQMWMETELAGALHMEKGKHPIEGGKTRKPSKASGRSKSGNHYSKRSKAKHSEDRERT